MGGAGGKRRQQQQQQQNHQSERTAPVPVVRHIHNGGSEISCCLKYSMFGFNVVFWLIGASFLTIGLWAWSEKGTLDNFTQATSIPLDPALVFVVVGGIVFILGFSGCIGALRENIYFLKFFVVFLSVMFLCEIGIAILGFFKHDWVETQLNTFVLDSIVAYRDDPDFQDVIDGLQQNLECCGATSYTDWDMNKYFNCSLADAGVPEACGVPFSCCIEDTSSDVVNTQCGYDVRNSDKFSGIVDNVIYTKGCVTMFKEWLEDNLIFVAGMIVAIIILQLLAIGFSKSLVSDIKRQKALWYRRP